MTVLSFINLFVVDFFVTIFLVFLMDSLFGLNHTSFIYKLEMINKNIILYIVLGGFFLPIFEEFLHRYYLDYRTRSLLISAFLMLGFFFISFDELNSFQNFIHFFCFLFLVVILLLKKIYSFINVKLLVWGSILFFGLFHLSTHEMDVYSNNYFIVPVLVMPQFIGGFFLAFIRINFRFIYCIFYHGFFNLALLLMIFISFKFFH